MAFVIEKKKMDIFLNNTILREKEIFLYVYELI